MGLSSSANGERTCRACAASTATPTPGNGCQGDSACGHWRRQAMPPVSVLPYTSIGASPKAAPSVAAVSAASGAPEEKMAAV